MPISFSKSQPPPVYPPQVVLGSQSAGRKMLLEKLGLRFRVVVTRVDEDKITHRDPTKTLSRRASAKAEEIVKNPNIYGIPAVGKVFLITADSMAIFGSKHFGKAKDREHAKAIVTALHGRAHIFATAIVMVLLENTKVIKRWDKLVKSKVTMRKLTVPELDSYIARYDFTRFAAGYALNEAPWDVIKKIEGSYTNVIGLPFEPLLPILRKLKIIV